MIANENRKQEMVLLKLYAKLLFAFDRDHIEIFVLLLYTFLRDSVLVTSFDAISRGQRTKQNKKKRKPAKEEF